MDGPDIEELRLDALKMAEMVTLRVGKSIHRSLGIRISRKGESTKIPNSLLVDSITERFYIADEKATPTPMEAGTTIDKEEDSKMTKAPYQELVGTLPYFDNKVRLDIYFTSLGCDEMFTQRDASCLYIVETISLTLGDRFAEEKWIKCSRKCPWILSNRRQTVSKQPLRTVVLNLEVSRGIIKIYFLSRKLLFSYPAQTERNPTENFLAELLTFGTSFWKEQY